MDKVKKTVMSIPAKAYGFIFALLLLVDAIAFNLEPLLEKIEICNVAAAYNSLTVLFPPITSCAKDYRCIFVVFTVIVLGLWLYRILYKPKLILIKQYSFTPDLAAVDPEYLHRYHVKVVEINQFAEMASIERINDAVVIQDDIVSKVLLSRKNSKLCYYGIAHTPLVFRLGFKIGDENNVMLLHKQRSNDTLFEELSGQGAFSTITSREVNKSVSSDELIVVVATSLEISEKDLQSLGSKNKHVLIFESNNLSFDSITSYKLAESFRNSIMIELRNYVKKYGINRIHLVLSTSVAFTFYLGQAFSPQHEPETIIYHFQNGTYPWGICINSSSTQSLIINDHTPSII